MAGSMLSFHDQVHRVVLTREFIDIRMSSPASTTFSVVMNRHIFPCTSLAVAPFVCIVRHDPIWSEETHEAKQKRMTSRKCHVLLCVCVYTTFQSPAISPSSSFVLPSPQMSTSGSQVGSNPLAGVGLPPTLSASGKFSNRSLHGPASPGSEGTLVSGLAGVGLLLSEVIIHIYTSHLCKRMRTCMYTYVARSRCQEHLRSLCKEARACCARCHLQGSCLCRAAGVDVRGACQIVKI